MESINRVLGLVLIADNTIEQTPSVGPPLSYINTNIHSLFFVILKDEIITVIYSPGCDKMPASILKQCVDTYIDPLMYFINLYLLTKVYFLISKKLKCFTYLQI